MGRHVNHSDTSNLPFSYLIEQNNTTYLVPGVNLRSVGTIRDAQKWPKRDGRTDSNKLDFINYNLTQSLYRAEDVQGTGNFAEPAPCFGRTFRYLFFP